MPENIMSNPKAMALFERVKNILLKPKDEWEKIAGENATIPDLYKNYLVILAAISPVCGFLGGFLFNHAHFAPAIGGAITGYILALAGAAAVAFACEALAPSFGGEKNQIGAFKLVIYSTTASALAGVFRLLPPLSGLTLLGLYSVYLFYLGAPKLMKVPQDKAVGYTLAVFGVAVILVFIGSMLLMRMM